MSTTIEGVEFRETFGPVIEWCQQRTSERSPGAGEVDDVGFLTSFLVIRLCIEYPDIARGIYKRAKGDLDRADGRHD